MDISVVVSGIISAIVTEAFKFIPALRASAITSALTAIIVTLVVTYLAQGTFSFEGFVASLVVALTTYKTVVQPIAIAARLSSQK